ncbi:MAG: DUF4169 family protein [Emcibacter sp.]|nr:DUF4169 family protein [Emcibacter sp.]
MSSIINFKQASKKITKAKKDKIAQENRVKFGLKRTIKVVMKQENKTHKAHLDDHEMVDKDNKN